MTYVQVKEVGITLNGNGLIGVCIMRYKVIKRKTGKFPVFSGLNGVKMNKKIVKKGIL